MEITRETDYAVRCMLHMAGSPGKVALMEEISRERQIPRPFLAKILQRLSRAGLVRSYRGVRGGFRLAREPRQITLLDVVETMQGGVGLNRCVNPRKGCGLIGTCEVHEVWEEASAKVSQVLAKYDFEKLLRRARARGRKKIRG